MNEKLGSAQRDKYWNERDSDQKLEALRNQVQQLTYQLGKISTLTQKLMAHSHADGKVVGAIDLSEPCPTYLPIELRINHDK